MSHFDSHQSHSNEFFIDTGSSQTNNQLIKKEDPSQSQASISSEVGNQHDSTETTQTERPFNVNDYLKRKNNHRKEYKAGPGLDVGDKCFPSNYYCTLCDVKSSGPIPFQNHIAGGKHKARVEENGGVKPENEEKFLKQRARNLMAKKLLGSVASIDECEIEVGFFYCKVCETKVSGRNNFENHLKGVKHAKKVKMNEFSGLGNVAEASTSNFPPPKLPKVPFFNEMLATSDKRIIGLQYLTEVHNNNPKIETKYVCSICESKCDPRNVMNHLHGTRHRLNYLKNHDEAKFTSFSELQLNRTEVIEQLEILIKELPNDEMKQDIKMEMEIDPFYDPTEITTLKRKAQEIDHAEASKKVKVEAPGGRGLTFGGRVMSSRGRGLASGGRGSSIRGRGYGKTFGAEDHGWNSLDYEDSYPGAKGGLGRDSQYGGMGGRVRHRDYEEDYHHPHDGKQYDRYGDYTNDSYHERQGYYEGDRDYTGQSWRNDWEGKRDPYHAQESREDSGKPSINAVLKKLTDCGKITTEQEAAVALEVSNVLTQALLTYRLNKTLT